VTSGYSWYPACHPASASSRANLSGVSRGRPPAPPTSHNQANGRGTTTLSTLRYRTDACEYPDGTRVLGAETIELRDGKIVRQVNVEAWDE
jgi:hypothetical protein